MTEITLEQAQNPDTVPEILHKLANSPNKDVRCNVAENPNTPVDTLAQLAVDPDILVRAYTASNTTTPVYLLDILAADEQEIVRRAVAKNPNTLAETLHKLATESSLYTRIGVARNLNTRNETLMLVYINSVNAGTLTDSLLTALLINNVSLTQTELIDLCELYDDSVKEIIKTNYAVTHPLLQKILNVNSISSKVNNQNIQRNQR